MRIALVHVSDSRDDFYSQREGICKEYIAGLDWLREYADCVESDILRSSEAISKYLNELNTQQIDAIIIHLPIWVDPIFSVQVAMAKDLPVLLLGNMNPKTSSVVATLGAGGALDQIGRKHIRVFLSDEESRKKVYAFLDAAEAVGKFHGTKVIRFGGSSIGILTAEPDTFEVMRKLGVIIEQHEQSEIVELAEKLPEERVDRFTDWVMNTFYVDFAENFNSVALKKQVRSYLATKDLAEKYGADILAVKCQRELSDGYVCQCLAVALFQLEEDGEGKKRPIVYSCESDTNGALTMHMLHCLSKGKPASLMDIRTLDVKTGRLVIANCGSVPASMLVRENSTMKKDVGIVKHTFGAGGGGGICGTLCPGNATVARICSKDGKLWVAAGKTEIVELNEDERAAIQRSFPACAMYTGFDMRFLEKFGSNHLHVVFGDYLEALQLFCAMKEMDCCIW